MSGMRTHPKYSQFRFDAGSPALNFVATVRHRGSPKPRDLLLKPESLAEWFEKAGCHSPAARPSRQDLESAIVLREAIYRSLRSCILKLPHVAADLNRLNSAAVFPIAVPQVETSDRVLHWKCEDPVRACLAEIARDAVMLIGLPERSRLKMCDNGGCRMLFLDNSPANRRRWCAMSICGNREKIRTHRQRKKPPDKAR